MALESFVDDHPWMSPMGGEGETKEDPGPKVIFHFFPTHGSLVSETSKRGALLAGQGQAVALVFSVAAPPER